jgi:medium-chain acyl-[acyl-carrier-protein] hydrolase
LLFASGSRAPQLPPDPEELEKGPTHLLSDEDFKEELRGMNGTPPEVLQHEELMGLLLPVLRADFAVCGTYEHAEEPPLDVPIVALGGLRDPDLNRAKLQAWGEQTAGSFSVRMFPGDHFYVKSDERMLMGVLATEMARHMKV